MIRHLCRLRPVGTVKPRKRPRRKGSIIVLSAFLIIFMMAILALSVDVGYMQNVSVEMDRAVDAGAGGGGDAASWP